MDNPFEGKSVEQIMEDVRKDWRAVCRRAEYISNRMGKAEFLDPKDQGATLQEGQMKTAAMFIAGVAAMHGGGQMKLADMLPMLGYLWTALDDAQGNLQNVKLNAEGSAAVRMPPQKGVH